MAPFIENIPSLRRKNTPWTPPQRRLAKAFFQVRFNKPDIKAEVSLKQFGRLIGKTAGQMNRASTEYRTRKQKRLKGKSAKRKPRRTHDINAM